MDISLKFQLVIIMRNHLHGALYKRTCLKADPRGFMKTRLDRIAEILLAALDLENPSAKPVKVKQRRKKGTGRPPFSREET